MSDTFLKQLILTLLDVSSASIANEKYNRCQQMSDTFLKQLTLTLLDVSSTSIVNVKYLGIDVSYAADLRTLTLLDVSSAITWH